VFSARASRRRQIDAGRRSYRALTLSVKPVAQRNPWMDLSMKFPILYLYDPRRSVSSARSVVHSFGLANSPTVVWTPRHV
jgi:hypothetical protein